MSSDGKTLGVLMTKLRASVPGIGPCGTAPFYELTSVGDAALALLHAARNAV